jgi:hypothetical protein
MDTLRPQLNLTELRQLRWFLGGLIGLLSSWTVFYMEVDALIVLAVITFTVPLFTLFPRLSLALPGVFHLLAFPVIVVLFALDIWSTREPLPAIIRLDLMLLCYRCIAPRGRREDLQLILLALFAVVVTGVFTVSIAFVAQILLFTAAALALLLAVTLSDSRGGDGGAKPAGGKSARRFLPQFSAAPVAPVETGWERVRWTELFSRLRSVADLRVVALGGVLFAGVIALSAVLFLALPRFEISNDFFLDRLITKSTRTGFSDNVTFQDVVNIQQDTSVALMIDVSDPDLVPAEPYWRMLVLDEYSGNGFRVSQGLRNTFVSSREKMHVHTSRGFGRNRDDRATWIMYFQPGVSKYLPLGGAFTRITFGEPQALLQSTPLRLAQLPIEPAKMVAYRVEGMDTDGILRDRDFARDRSIRVLDTRYGVPVAEIPPERAAEFGLEEPPPREVTFLDLGLERPEDVALLKKWVEELGGPGEGGAEFARRAAAWLQSRHSYSLSMRLEEGPGDPLIRWLASSQPGHCELFAGGLVMLSRAAGVPARLVTGFKGGVWNTVSGSITVRNSDAHAWTEIWDDNLASWLRADATPGAQTTPNASPTAGFRALEFDSGWAARFDGLRVFWYRRIVNFDQDSQMELLRGTKDRVRATLVAMREWAEGKLRSFADWVRSPWDFSRVAGILAVLLGGAGLVWGWKRAGRAWWMGWRSRRSASHRRDPVRIEASRWLARIERFERGRGHLPPDARETIKVCRARLLRLRFGARESWAPPAAVFRQAKQALRSIARARR